MSKIGRITTAGVVTNLYPTLTAGAAPTAIAMGPDGNLWFSESGASQVGRITTAGVMTEFPLPDTTRNFDIAPGPGGLWVPLFGAPPPPQIDADYPIPFAGLPYEIASGSDGALWFASNNQLGRSTTAGTITAFPLGYGGFAQSVVSGPDGNLWFTDPNQKIGRMTTAGVVTTFTTVGDPTRLAVGPDGALWFTEGGANRIGRMTTAGVVTNEFPIPVNAHAQGIVAGPDGNIWFTESFLSRIGRMKTSGALTEFPLPQTTRLFDIAVGPDGNLWFPEFDANRIGRLTTAGALLEFLIPTPDSKPYGITAGPDGKLWFTEFGANRVGKVTPPPPPTGSGLVTLAPCRIVDTRNPSGPLGGPALAANTSRLFTLTGVCGVPAAAKAVAVNVAVTQGGASGNLILSLAGSAPPLTSFINYASNQTRANNGVIALGIGGSILVQCNQASGSVHFILDVTGYFP